MAVPEVSIYGTWLSLDNDKHEDDCGIWAEHNPEIFDMLKLSEDASRLCTCGTPRAPYVYRGSHILPSLDDPRTGAIEFAAINGHITRDGKDDGHYDDYHKFIRFSVGQESVVLHERHVQELHRELGEWLARGKVPEQ